MSDPYSRGSWHFVRGPVMQVRESQSPQRVKDPKLDVSEHVDTRGCRRDSVQQCQEAIGETACGWFTQLTPESQLNAQRCSKQR